MRTIFKRTGGRQKVLIRNDEVNRGTTIKEYNEIFIHHEFQYTHHRAHIPRPSTPQTAPFSRAPQISLSPRTSQLLRRIIGVPSIINSERMYEHYRQSPSNQVQITLLLGFLPSDQLLEAPKNRGRRETDPSPAHHPEGFLPRQTEIAWNCHLFRVSGCHYEKGCKSFGRNFHQELDFFGERIGKKRDIKLNKRIFTKFIQKNSFKQIYRASQWRARRVKG